MRDDKFPWVGGVPVVPAEELVGVVGYGSEGDSVALEVDAAAVDMSADRVVWLCGDVVVVSVGEVGGKGGVLCDEDGAGVVGVAIIPPGESVCTFGDGVDCLVDMFGQLAVGLGCAHGAVGREGVHHGVVNHGLDIAV